MAIDNKSQQALEELIQRELSQLPERQAPATLIPQVLARIRAKEGRRWWQRPWSYWPFVAQLASLPLMLATAGGAVFVVTLLWKLLVASPELVVMSEKLNWLSVAWNLVSALGNSLMLLGRSGDQWLLLGLFVPLTMYLACVGVGTLCYRMAVQQR